MTSDIASKLKLNRLSEKTFSFLYELTLPEDIVDPSHLGTYIHTCIGRQLGIDIEGTVDISEYGIEIKSKNIESDSSWTIGSVTLSEFLLKSYKSSKFFEKLQALLLVVYDTTTNKIVKYDLCYLNYPDIQHIIEEAYEDINKQLVDYMKVRREIAGEATFSPFQTFKATNKFMVLEYNENQVKLRISSASMKKLIKMSNSAISRNNLVQFV